MLNGDVGVATRNVCIMHTLERIAARFNEAGVPLMVLKGGALNLTLYERPDERPMGDLDLLVRIGDLARVVALLEELGCVPGEPLVREDFFPRFYYERDFSLGDIWPVRIDLHARPFRPLRYSRIVPEEAFWSRAEPVRIGQATFLAPAAEEMLIHLAAHSAIHGNGRSTWLRDIKRWVEGHARTLDWQRFVDTVESWGLTLPVRVGIKEAQRRFGNFCPDEVIRKLFGRRVSWRDRLALAQAPRDASHPVAHVTVDFLCTPGWRFSLEYLWAMAVPGREHMGQWYRWRHRGWLPAAHVLRILWPIVGRLPQIHDRFSKVDIRDGRAERNGVYARKDFQAGEVIARCRGRAVSIPTGAPGWEETRFGRTRRYEVRGRLACLDRSERPNAKLAGRELVALRPIRAREEITIGRSSGARERAGLNDPLAATSAA